MSKSKSYPHIERIKRAYAKATPARRDLMLRLLDARISLGVDVRTQEVQSAFLSDVAAGKPRMLNAALTSLVAVLP